MAPFSAPDFHAAVGRAGTHADVDRAFGALPGPPGPVIRWTSGEALEDGEGVS